MDAVWTRRAWLIWATVAMLTSSPVEAPQSSGRRRATIADGEQAEPQRTYQSGEVHLGSSRVIIHVFKTGLGHEHGVMGQLRAGRIVLDAPGAGGELVFDMQSFDADSEPARRAVGLEGTIDPETRKQVNANMHGPGVLDTQRHPTAGFEIKTVTKIAQISSRGLPQYRLAGDFTLHGVTQPIEVVADVERKNGWLHLRGGFAILQTNYGIQPFRKAFGVVGVADRLEIWGDLWIADGRPAGR